MPQTILDPESVNQPVQSKGMRLLLDGISITMMSLPITLPIIIRTGLDPLWFGVFLVIMVELGQITPPVDFNLFVLQSLTGESIGRY